jgi:hypothetical protein
MVWMGEISWLEILLATLYVHFFKKIDIIKRKKS